MLQQKIHSSDGFPAVVLHRPAAVQKAAAGIGIVQGRGTAGRSPRPATGPPWKNAAGAHVGVAVEDEGSSMGEGEDDGTRRKDRPRNALSPSRASLVICGR